MVMKIADFEGAFNRSNHGLYLTERSNIVTVLKSSGNTKLKPRRRIKMNSFAGKVAVITGGSSGIGLATAKRLVEEGAFVYITGRRQTELDKAVSLIGHSVAAVQGDVSSLADLDKLYAKVAREKGKIDILFAGAGIVDPQPLAETTEESFDKVFAINTRGLAFTVKKALPLLNDGGAIIVITSIAESKGIPGFTAYSATKAAIRSFVRTWTAELKDRRIRVNAISPGPIDTPIFDQQAPTKEGADQARAQFAAAVPFGRLGRPEEIASTALFLASDEASFIAGVDLPVDGGMTAI
jgi:NAD(P)-dependent dehydrogenase (short-subunit alcohol dehydrogenase family)